MALPLLGGALTLALVVPAVVRILVGLGIGIVSYTGMEFFITSAETYIFGQYDSLGSSMYLIFTLAGFDEGLKILFAAYSAKIAVQIAMGAFKKFSIIGLTT